MAIDIIARGMIEESSGDVGQLSEKVNSHTENSDIHVTATDKDNWNGYAAEIEQNKTDISTVKTDIQNLQNQDNVLSSRIDNLSTLSEGSTTGDAELIDMRVGADGNTYPNAGTAVRTQVSELKSDLVDIIMVNRSNQLFNSDNASYHYNYGVNGDRYDRDDMTGDFVEIEPNTIYTLSGTFTYSACLDKDKNWIETYANTTNPYTFTTPNNAKYLYVASANNVYKKIVLNKGNKALPKDDYFEHIYAKVYDYSLYKLPYIKAGKVMCNKGIDTRTAYYAGVECSEKINEIICNWIWEKGTNSGVLALISNPNGADRITNITDLSLHLVLDNNHVKVDVLGGKFGNYYYQNIINKPFATPLELDGVTEHTVTLVADVNTNNVNVYLDNVESFVGTFIPDENITGLDMVIGRYATFEHYTELNRDEVAMPMITKFWCRDINNYVQVSDYFDREDGQLVNTPQGKPYHLMSTLRNLD